LDPMYQMMLREQIQRNDMLEVNFNSYCEQECVRGCLKCVFYERKVY